MKSCWQRAIVWAVTVGPPHVAQTSVGAEQHSGRHQSSATLVRTMRPKSPGDAGGTGFEESGASAERGSRGRSAPAASRPLLWEHTEPNEFDSLLSSINHAMQNISPLWIKAFITLCLFTHSHKIDWLPAACWAISRVNSTISPPLVVVSGLFIYFSIFSLPFSGETSEEVDEGDRLRRRPGDDQVCQGLCWPK